MLKTRRFWLGLVLSIVFLALFFYKVDLADMGRALLHANYLLLVPAIAVYFVAVWFRSMRWSYLLRPLCRASPRRLYPVVVIGYMANNLLPVRLGEVVRAYFLGEKEPVSKTAALGTIAVERLLDGITLLVFMLVVSPLVPLSGLLRDLSGALGISWVVLALVIAGPFVVVLGLLALLVARPGMAQALVGRVARWLPARWGEKARGLTGRFLEGLWILNSPGKLAVAFLLSVAVWLTEGAMFAILAYSFRLGATFGVLLMALALSNLATTLPSTGGGIGPFEFFAARTLAFFGVGTALANAYTLVLHAALLLPPTLLGFVFLWSENLSLGYVLRQPAEGKPARAYAVPLEGEVKE